MVRHLICLALRRHRPAAVLAGFDAGHAVCRTRCDRCGRP
jgi:hypothetical protein